MFFFSAHLLRLLILGLFQVLFHLLMKRAMFKYPQPVLRSLRLRLLAVFICGWFKMRICESRAHDDSIKTLLPCQPSIRKLGFAIRLGPSSRQWGFVGASHHSKGRKTQHTLPLISHWHSIDMICDLGMWSQLLPPRTNTRDMARSREHSWSPHLRRIRWTWLIAYVIDYSLTSCEDYLTCVSCHDPNYWGMFWIQSLDHMVFFLNCFHEHTTVLHINGVLAWRVTAGSWCARCAQRINLDKHVHTWRQRMSTAFEMPRDVKNWLNKITTYIT